MPKPTTKSAHPGGIAHFFSDHPKLGPLMGLIALGAGLSQRHTEFGVWVCMAGACVVTLLWAHDIAIRRGRALGGTLKGLPYCLPILLLGWWLNEPPLLKIVFKRPIASADDISPYRRYTIGRSITHYAAYLSDLGFELPKSPPIIGIGARPGVIDGVITLRNGFTSKQVVWTYSQLVFTSSVNAGSLFGSQRAVQRIIISMVYGSYFDCSYEDTLEGFTDPIKDNKFFQAIWELRLVLTQYVIDRALAYALIQIIREGLSDDGISPDIDSYFGRAIEAGIDKMSSNFTEDKKIIDAVFKKYNIHVVYPKINRTEFTVK
jgi:hypothetical protein